MATKKKPAAKVAAKSLQEAIDIAAKAQGVDLTTPGGPMANAAAMPAQQSYPMPGEVGGPPVVASSPMGLESSRPLPLDEAEAAIIQQLNDMAADAERLGRAILTKTVVNRYKSTFDIAANAAVRRIKAAIAVIG